MRSENKDASKSTNVGNNGFKKNRLVRSNASTKEILYRIKDRKSLFLFPVIVLLVLGLVFSIKFYAENRFVKYLELRYPEQVIRISNVRPTLIPLGFKADAINTSDNTKFSISSSLGYQSIQQQERHFKENETSKQNGNRNSNWAWFYKDNYNSERNRESIFSDIEPILNDSSYKSYIKSFDIENREISSRTLEQTVAVTLTEPTGLRLKINFNNQVLNRQSFENLTWNLWTALENELSDKIASIVFESVVMQAGSDASYFEDLGYTRKTWIETVTTTTEASESDLNKEISKKSKETEELEPTIVASGYSNKYFKYQIVLSHGTMNINQSTIHNGIHLVEMNSIN